MAMSNNHLEQLEPKEVFHYFAEIADIPRPSGNEKAISDYLVRFARQHHLEHYQDELNNVIIIKEATAGYETAPPVILQGHMDMVCEKEPDSPVDPECEGLDLFVEGDYLSARGTTLGGDDGIAVAYALAILASDTLKHPRIEFVCTVSEETGMEGASGIDVSMLRGRRMINLDSETENEMMCGCAGGGRVVADLPVQREKMTGDGYESLTVKVTGLTGGHSGTEINRGRANAVILLAETLAALNKKFSSQEFRVGSFAGGNKDNAIPREASAEILIAEVRKPFLEKELEEIEQAFCARYGNADPDIKLVLESRPADGVVFTAETAEKLLAMILEIPNGVQNMSSDIPDLVETSLNLGIAKTAEEAGNETMQLHYSLRSSVAESFEKLAQKVIRTAEAYGAVTGRSGEYPAWEFRKDSELRDVMMPVYEEMFGKKPEVTVLHAGVECGLLAEKLPGLDAVSIGPDILDIHTTEERLSVSSAERMYQYVLRVLELMK
ncbi:MAG: aminoacyl-histidine dipeptidase [Eubacterium sp.]|nr:aminoacyl-histidine dipeptidase [Eubacterium sp.]